LARGAPEIPRGDRQPLRLLHRRYEQAFVRVKGSKDAGLVRGSAEVTGSPLSRAFRGGFQGVFKGMTAGEFCEIILKLTSEAASPAKLEYSQPSARDDCLRASPCPAARGRGPCASIHEMAAGMADRGADFQKLPANWESPWPFRPEIVV
jgi:hypothetical protein